MSGTGKARLATVVELLFDGFLLLCFIAQTFLLGCLLIYGHLPLPTNWVSRTITEQLPEGITIRAESYALSLDGNVRVKNIQLQLDGIQQAIFTADYAHAEFGTEWGSEKFFQLKKFVLSDGNLTLPAVYSPDGEDSSILEQIALRLLPSEEGITIDSFAALHQDIRLRGSINWILDDIAREPVNVREKADLFFKQIATVLKQKPKLTGFTRPTILFSIDAGSNQAFNISSRVSSRAYEQPEVQARNLTLDAELSLTDQTLVSKSFILLEADEIELPGYNTRASYVMAKVERDDWEALLKGEWPDMEVMAEKLNIEEIELTTPSISISPQNFPDIAFQGFTSGLTGAVQFSGAVNAKTRAASIAAAGSLDLLSVAPENITNRLPAIIINEAPYYNLDANFTEGFALNQAALRARVDELEVEGLKFNHIRLRGNYTDGIYSIDKLYLRRDWQWLDLGFNLDSSTNDYALKLKGFAKPYDYNPILPRWWGGIFREFDFEQVESGLGDFVIYGNTGGKAADFFFGHATARNVAYKGVRVDEGELFVRGRGPYAEVHRLNARSGEGYARGDIHFATRLDEVRGPMSVRLDLDTKLPLSDAQKLFDENIAKILSDFQTEALPQTTLKGAIFNNSYPEFHGLSYIDLKASCPSPIRYKGIPLDYLSFDLYGRPKITYLRNIQLGYADGKAIADADILTAGEEPAETRFQATLKGANQEEAVSQLTALGKSRVHQRNDTAARSKGRLDFNLHARGPVEDPFKMNGYGSLKIENEELYAIQLFGPLSRLLQNTLLGFTSFALNQLNANFALEAGTVRLNNFVINGPRTRIEAPGIMQLDDYSLAMRVSVYLFGNAGNPDSNIRKLSDLITRPIPNLLEFELTGTPDAQNWRSLYDPRKLIPRF